MSTTILCALSVLRKKPGESDERAYSYDGKEYKGAQTNEAPVKALLDCCGDTNITVLCLCTKECRRPLPGRYSDTFDYFSKSIQAFAEVKGLTVEVRPLAYSFEHAEQTLPLIIGQLDSLRQDEGEHSAPMKVDIDLTGGGRDETSLLVLATTALSQQRGYEIGRIVYSNFANYEIVDQDKTFELTGLIRAVSAFTDYAQGSALRRFFSHAETSKEVTDACESLCRFSDALSLCRVGEIADLVRKVQLSLQHLYQLTGEYVSSRTETAGCQEPSGESPGQHLEERDSEASADLCATASENTQYRPSELLFASMVPDIMDSFVSGRGPEGRIIVSTVRWCADHRLAQQALCIFREHMGRCLVELGYLQPTNRFMGLEERNQQELLRGVYNAFEVLEAKAGNVERFKSRCSLSIMRDGKHKNVSPKDYFRIYPGMGPRLAQVVPWLLYIKRIRNLVAHSDYDDGSEQLQDDSFVCACEILGKATDIERDADRGFDLDDVRCSVLDALAVIEDQGRGWIPLEDAEVVVVPDTPSDEPSDSSPLDKVFQQAHDDLVAYARWRRSQGKSLVFKINEDFNTTWAVENGKTPLKRELLGLGKSTPINKALAGKFPKDFSAQSGGVIEVHLS